MDTCDVLVVGGGPAGSACAWALRHAGLDVVVADRATFPRDKVCAGSITPQVIDDLQIDPDEYRNGRTFQPITGFRVGLVGVDEAVDAIYDRAVSFGIRRCEFDDYLLRRSQARLQLGTPISSLRRTGGGWIVNESLTTPMLVGAGGHFCPVARLLNPASERMPLVAAQEVEFAVDPRETPSFAVSAEAPELYFCQDLKGYGWCVRKQNYLNLGFGRLDPRGLPRASAEFVDFLKTRHRIPHHATWRWRGHAYLVSESPRRSVIGAAVVLVGDSAGLAYPQSGEGIRPAIESGLMAASTILDAQGQYSLDRLLPYARDIRRRFGGRSVADFVSRAVPSAAWMALARRLLARPWFVRAVLLERGFLHAQELALVTSAPSSWSRHA